MRKLLALLSSLLIALGLLAAASPAQAARAADPAVTITVDGDPSVLPLVEAAEDWSIRTGVNVVVGPCSGAYCVHVVIVDQPCPSGGVVIGFVGGCARGSSDPGACEVQFNDDLLTGDALLRLYVTKHEIGHCVYWFGGAGFIHLDSKRALMKDGLAGYPSANETNLTAEDRKFAAALFG